MSKSSWRCSLEACKSLLPSDHVAETPCPYCGHIGRTGEAEITETIEMFDSTRVVKKDPKFPSNKRKRVDDFQGWETCHATREMVKKTRRVDKDAGTYHEHVETRDGTVIHHNEETLADHRGHGDAKFKK